MQLTYYLICFFRYTYLWWNMAQQEQFAAVRPNTRFFSLNRAFQPGMQRYAAATWSGDRQDCSHRMLIRFAMYGQPYAACDMTSPTANVLLRQYQNAVWMPLMRSHAMKGIPRFPFLWSPTAEHEVAFREALEMRYRFLPFMYSLAHAAYRYGRPIGHPASFEFPEFALGDDTYMVGGVLLPANWSAMDCHTVGGDDNINHNAAHQHCCDMHWGNCTAAGPGYPGGPCQNCSVENHTQVHLPGGERWFEWNSTAMLAGGQTVVNRDTSLGESPLYVRAGAILPLQTEIVQFAEKIGGLLTLQVYAGRNGRFEMVEDDGVSFDYQVSASPRRSVRAPPAAGVRTTVWTWDDTAKTLTYSVDGTYVGPSSFTEVTAELFVAGASAAVRSAVRKLSATGGTIPFPPWPTA